MAKAAVTRSIRDDHQKNFLKIFNGLTGKHSRWEIWEDFVTLTAIEISNSTDKVNAPERTKMYQTIISKYSAKERDGMAEMLAEITFDPKLHPDMEGFISVSDPACGAGATLLAFLNVCKRRNICYHNKVLVIAQDIDFIVGLMCYIQCSFMGCAGYVVIGDTLVNPATAYDSRGLLPAGPQNRIWYMPLFSTDVWYMRRQIAQMNLLFEPKVEPVEIEKADTKPANLQKSIKSAPKESEKQDFKETRNGQLTFF
nr:MAG TPA: type-1 restriction enzyme [Caudoviricetes sp.]